jgi:uncharacterized integral membrane protein
MRWVRRPIGVAVVVAVMVGGWRLAADNAADVPVDFLLGFVQVPLWQALLASFAAGFLLAGAGGLWFAVRARLMQRRYRKAVGGLESELHQLRNLPLAPDTAGSGALSPDLARVRIGEKGG